jgi:hypothetical protein
MCTNKQNVFRLLVSVLALGLFTFAWAENSTDSTETVLEVHMSDASVRVVTETETREELRHDDSYSDDTSVEVRYFDDEDGRFYFDEDVVIDSDERIGDAVVVLFGDLDVYGQISGDVVIVMGDLTLHDHGSIAGDAVCLGGKVASDSTSVFEGEVVCFPISALLTGKGWKVLTGSENQIEIDSWANHDNTFSVNTGGLSAFGQVLKLLGMLFVALLLQIIFRRRIEKVTSTLRYRPWKSLLFGLLFFLGLIVLFIPVIITLVLVLAFLAIVLSPIPPLMILVLIAFILSIVVVVLGLVVVPGMMTLFTLSRFTWEKRGLNALLSVLLWVTIFWTLGALAEWVGGFLTGFGVLIEIMFYTLGIGALLGSRMGAVYVERGKLPAMIPADIPIESPTPEDGENPPPVEA